MRYVTEQWVEYDSETGKSTVHPWYIGKDIWFGRLFSDKFLIAGKLPWWLRFSYRDYSRRASMYHPIPINYIVKLWEKVYF